MSTNTEDERRQGVKPENEFPGGDLTSRAKEAIAREVANRRKHGLPIASSARGQRRGVEYLLSTGMVGGALSGLELARARARCFRARTSRKHLQQGEYRPEARAVGMSLDSSGRTWRSGSCHFEQVRWRTLTLSA